MNKILGSYLAVVSFWILGCTAGTQDTPVSAPTAVAASSGQSRPANAPPPNSHDKVRGDQVGILLSQADTDGDDLPESIVVCRTASICVNHPASGVDHTYTQPHWEHVVLLAVQDTDGQKGAEIIVLAMNSEGSVACVCVIHDGTQSIASYRGPRWSSATVRSVLDTDGQPGDEIIAIVSDSDGHAECVCIIRDRDGLLQAYTDPSWRSVEVNWLEDADGIPGAEVIVEVRGENGQTYCICVIHHRDDRIVTYRDPFWKTASVQMLIDTDGKAGGELVTIYSTDIDGGVSIIHDRGQLINTISYSGDHPNIQQVGNYDNAPGAELCVLLVNHHAYELITDRTGEHVRIDSCEVSQRNGRT